MIKNIIKEYKDLTALDKIYLRLRWNLSQIKIVEKLIPKEGLIIDLGCGYGILGNLLCLTSEKRKVIGVDLSEKRINKAKKSENKNKKLEFLQIDITKYKIKKVDAIAMTDFLHHIKYNDQEELISKLYKKLNKNGRLIIVDIKKDKTLKYMFTYFLDRVLNYGDKVYYRTEQDMKNLLEKNGFKTSILKADKFLPTPTIVFIAIKS